MNEVKHAADDRAGLVRAFQISDAAIHRIQTLSNNLSQTLKHIHRIAPFRAKGNVLFVRRDFECTLNDQLWFNPVFYRPEVSVNEVNDKHVASAIRLATLTMRKGKYRRAVEKAIECLKDSRFKGDAERRFHCALEIFSRVPYRGLIPQHICEALKTDGSSPTLLFLVEFVRSSSGGITNETVSLYPGVSRTTQHPLMLTTEGENLVGDYKILQDLFEGPYGPNGTFWFCAIPVFEHLDNTSTEDPSEEDTLPASCFGALLGVAFLPIENLENPVDAQKRALKQFPKLAATLNRFSAELLESEFRDLLREDFKRTTGPLQFVMETLPRFDGWDCEELSSNDGDVLKIENNSVIVDMQHDLLDRESHKENNLKLRLKPASSATYLSSGSNGDKYAVVLARRIRAYYQRVQFIAQQARIDELEKHRQMLDLLSGPLNNLAGALAEMQRDTQELRAILYDPPMAIFESHQRLRELFQERTPIHISPYIRFIVAHEPRFYTSSRPFYEDKLLDAELSEEAGIMCMIEAVCRIFGVEEELREARDFEQLQAVARYALFRGKHKAFEDLSAAILWLFKKSGHSLANIQEIPFVTADQARRFLEHLKAVAFTPFKIDADTWNCVAVELALWAYMDTDKISYTGFDGMDSSVHQFSKFSTRSPASYSTVLDFLLKMCVSQSSRKPTGCTINRLSVTGKPVKFVVEIVFSESFEIDETGASDLRTLIAPLLGGLRDWRLLGSNIGNWQGPFVDLTNRLVGVAGDVERSQNTWSPQECANGEILRLCHSKAYGFAVSLCDVDDKGKLTLLWE